MTSEPDFEQIFAVMAEASVGNTSARVEVPEEPTEGDLATRFAIALNLLLEDLAHRSAEKEQSIRELEQQKQRLASIYETAADVIFQLTVEAPDVYRFSSVNPAFTTITGLHADQVIGKRVDQVLPEPSLSMVLHNYRKAIQEKSIVRWEETSDYPTGRLTGEVSIAPVFDQSGNCTHLVGAVHDVTERKQLEQSILEREVSFRLLFENNPQPMWVFDLQTLRFLEVNDAAIEKYGFSRDEFLAMRISDIRPRGDVARLEAFMARERPDMTSAGEWKHRLSDGTIIEVEILSHTIEFNNRAARLVVAFDVTERNRAKQQIERLNVELENRVRIRTAELEAVNRELEAFAYSVSHDLRAPLRAIDGFSQILLRDHQDGLPETARTYLERIRRNTQQMGVLIDDLLAFSRIGRRDLDREHVDPGALVRQVATELEHSFGDTRPEITFEELPPASADPAMLKVVFTNLLENAVKFTRTRRQPEIVIGSERTDSGVCYFVRDNGIGFDMKYADKVFGVFQRLHRAEDYEGTGVGLATVQRIIHRHGGRVWAEAQPDRGATFRFNLGEEMEHELPDRDSAGGGQPG